MRINSINSFTTTPLAFGAQNKNKTNNGLMKSAKAVMLATALSAAAGGCDKLSYNVEHNHIFEIPTDTFTQSELTPTPIPPQVIIIENDIPGKTDTVLVPQPPDTVIIEKPGKPDTIYVSQPPDTVVIEKPPIIKWDTIYLAGDTVWMKEDWTSPVPPKQEEIYDDLGIVPTGDGKFYISMSYYDRKNLNFVQRHLDGQASSRDGSVLVYNVIKTKWDNEAEGIVLGKNETYEKQLVYLSDDESQLGMKIMSPKVDINASNNNKESNWYVFDEGTLSTPDAWQDSDSFFATPMGGIVELTNGFTLKPGMTEQSVTTINPYNSEWELTDWSVIKGDAD